MNMHDIPGNHVLSGYVAGHATAGSADEFVIGRAPFNCVVKAVYWTPNAAVTGANSNYFSAKLVNRGAAGGGTTAVANLDFTSGVNATAFDEKAITLSATAANLNLAEGDILSLDKVVTGTGLAMPDGHVTVLLQAR